MDPRLVYRNGGPHQRPNGSFDYKLVSTEAERAAAIDDGWFDSLPEAINGEQAIDEGAPTRAELEAKATELDIKFDGRTTDRKLSAAIEAALAEA